jgi:ribose transport system permease protein
MFKELKERRLKNLLVKYPQIGTLMVFLTLIILFTIISPVNKKGQIIFLLGNNWKSVLEATAACSIGGFAMTLVLLTGGIDLSCGAIIASSGMIAARLLQMGGIDFGLVVVIILVVGAIAGLSNSLLIIKFKVPPFLATLGISGIMSGLAYLVSDGESIYVSNDEVINIFGYGNFLGIPVLAWWTIAIMFFFYIVITKTKFGRRAQAVGGNEQAAFNSGVKIAVVKSMTYMMMGLVSAFIAFTSIGRIGSAMPTLGLGSELDFIVAAVLGGTTFDGQGGNVFGTLLGSLVLGTLINGLTIVGVSAYLQEVIRGFIIILAVVWSVYISNKR